MCRGTDIHWSHPGPCLMSLRSICFICSSVMHQKKKKKKKMLRAYNLHNPSCVHHVALCLVNFFLFVRQQKKTTKTCCHTVEQCWNRALVYLWACFVSSVSLGPESEVTRRPGCNFISTNTINKQQKKQKTDTVRKAAIRTREFSHSPRFVSYHSLSFVFPLQFSLFSFWSHLQKWFWGDFLIISFESYSVCLNHLIAFNDSIQ